MMRTRSTYILLAILYAILCSGCSSAYRVAALDPRCQARQYCVYTDPPPAVRTTVLRPDSNGYMSDPAVR